MSGGPRPFGREYNPKGNLVGTQTFKIINGAFGFLCLVSVVSGFAFLKNGGPENPGRVWKWFQSKFQEKDYSVDVKLTQARIKAIRERKRLEEDPLYSISEPKDTARTNSNASASTNTSKHKSNSVEEVSKLIEPQPSAPIKQKVSDIKANTPKTQTASF